MDSNPRQIEVSDPASLMAGLRGLFSAQPLAVLATSDEGHPYCSLVAFTASEGLNELVFVTSRSTRKFANLARDPRVSLLVDDRSNDPSDFHSAMAVTATGTAREAQDRDRDRLLRLFLGRHPHLEEFALSPGCALVRVSVSRYTVVRQFQNVMVLQVG